MSIPSQLKNDVKYEIKTVKAKNIYIQLQFRDN
jgi:hypothetical protein